MRMWGSLTKMQSSIKINTNIVIDDWNNGWANPVDMTNEGFRSSTPMTISSTLSPKPAITMII